MHPVLHRTTRSWVGLFLPFLLILALLTGCNAIPGFGTPGTPTPNPTLLAIESMLTATAGAPTTTPIPPPTGTPPPAATVTVGPEPAIQGQVGQEMSAKNFGLRMLSASFLSQVGEIKPPEGSTFLDVEVVLQNLAPQGGSLLEYTSFFFTISGPNGEQWTAFTFPQDDFDARLPRLLGGNLLPGEAVRGHVTFQVQTEPGMVTLVYAPPPSGADAQPPVFTVGLSQADGSIPSSSIPAAGTVELNSDTWLAESLPRLDHWLELDGMGLKVETARSTESFEGRRAPTNSRYLILQVRLRNLSRPQAAYNPQYFKLKDERGYEYLPVILAADTMLHAGSLPAQGTVQGLVIFILPSEPKRVGVIYQPQSLTEEWPSFRIAFNIPN